MKKQKELEPSTPAEAEIPNTATLCRKSPLIDNLKQMMAHSTEKEILFEIEANQDSKVFIAGTFNDWSPKTHPLEYYPQDGVFRAFILLEPGIHEYKFVVDGVWQMDVNCPDWVLNDNGTLNSVIRV